MRSIKNFFAKKKLYENTGVSTRKRSPSMYLEKTSKQLSTPTKSKKMINKIQGQNASNEKLCVLKEIIKKGRAYSMHTTDCYKQSNQDYNIDIPKLKLPDCKMNKNRFNNENDSCVKKMKILLKEKEAENRILISIQKSLESELENTKKKITDYKLTIKKQKSEISKLSLKLRTELPRASVMDQNSDNYQPRPQSKKNASFMNIKFFDDHLSFKESQLQKALNKNNFLVLENRQLKIKIEKISRKNDILAKSVISKDKKNFNSVFQLQAVKNKLAQLDIHSYFNEFSDFLYKIKTELEFFYKMFLSELTKNFDKLQTVYSVDPETLGIVDKSMNNILIIIQDAIEKSIKDQKRNRF